MATTLLQFFYKLGTNINRYEFLVKHVVTEIELRYFSQQLRHAVTFGFVNFARCSLKLVKMLEFGQIIL